MRAASTACRLVLAPLAGLAGLGCAAQLEGGAGVAVPEERHAAPLWAGDVSVSYVGKEHSPRIGAELGQRNELGQGSSWNLGVQAGYVRNPGPSVPVGGSVYASFGTPLHHSTLFADGELDWGAGGELLLWLYGDRGPDDLNAGQWLLVRKPELFIFGRARFHRIAEDPVARDYSVTSDFVLGTGLRLRAISEFF